MRRIITEVDSCFQCPDFCTDDHDRSYKWCGHSEFDYGCDNEIDSRIIKEDLIDGFPKFCPLKKED